MLVVAALIERHGRILIGQRRSTDPHPLKWEFPGGKVEPTETPEHALIRELREELAIEGAVNPATGWLMDFAELHQAWAPLYQELDHRYLNDVVGLENPTSEILSRYIWDKLKPRLPQLCRVTLYETCESRCEYEGR